MNTCRTCKFWGRYVVGACDRIEEGSILENDKDAFVEAMADDDSGMTVRIMTGPEFGCTLWEGNYE